MSESNLRRRQKPVLSSLSSVFFQILIVTDCRFLTVFCETAFFPPLFLLVLLSVKPVRKCLQDSGLCVSG